jgi:O-antigen/teichoic acid export membrane protein
MAARLPSLAKIDSDPPPPVSRKRTILVNTISNIGMQVVSAGLPFLLLPYMLRYWGTETYGILVLAYSVQTFVFFLNSAINLTLMKYVSEVHELRDAERLNTVVNIFWLVAFLNNLVVALTLVVIGSWHLDWLNVPPALIDTGRHVFLIMGACSLAAGAFSFMDGVMYGLQRIHQSNMFRVTEALLIAVTAVATIHLHGTMPWYVFVIGIIPVLSRAGQFLYLKRLLPALRLDVAHYFNFQELKRLSKFSGYQIVNQVADLLLFNVHKIIIQKLMGSSSLTMYEIANKPNLLFQNFISLPLSAILPACSAAYARGDWNFLEKMLIQGTRIYLVLVLPPIIAFLALMKPFITLWLGAQFAPAALTAQLFLWSLVAACPFKIFVHMMVGKGRVFEYGVTKLVYAVIGVPVSVALIWKFGIIGGVSVVLAYYLVAESSANLYIMKKEGISSSHLLGSIASIFGVLALQYVVMSFVAALGFGSTWIQLGLVMAFGTAVTAATAFFFVLGQDERALVGVKF